MSASTVPAVVLREGTGGVDEVLPSTGGPDQVWLVAGVALLLAGSGLVLMARRRAEAGRGSRTRRQHRG